MINMDENNTMELIKNNMKQEFLKTMNQMTNEIENVFDYVSKDNIVKLKQYIEKISTNDEEFQKELTNTFEELKKYDKSLVKVVTATKVKSEDLKFLKHVKLFDNILHFKVFHGENKNTKKTFIKYLYNIYTNAIIMNDMSLENMMKHLNNNENKMALTQNLNPMNNMFENLNPMNDMFGSFLGNPNILQMATELSQDIQNQNIDPMSLLTSIMSGRPSPQMNNILNKMTSQIEEKINNGEIDKQELEKQAMTIMNTIGQSDLMTQFKHEKE
jgi:hypothetical protein